MLQVRAGSDLAPRTNIKRSHRADSSISKLSITVFNKAYLISKVNAQEIEACSNTFVRFRWRIAHTSGGMSTRVQSFTINFQRRVSWMFVGIFHNASGFHPSIRHLKRVFRITMHTICSCSERVFRYRLINIFSLQVWMGTFLFVGKSICALRGCICRTNRWHQDVCVSTRRCM